MPYKDPEVQKEYQRVWVAKRRAKYLKDKHCKKCGTTDILQIDHKDPSKKWKHRFWSYKWSTIFTELKKCQILCEDCHFKKTAEDIRKMRKEAHGTPEGYNKWHCRCPECKIYMKASEDEYTSGMTLEEANRVH